MNFCTVATPHIGLLKTPQLFSTVAAALGPKLLSRTGEQFYCVDKWSATGKPLLEVMADPRTNSLWNYHTWVLTYLYTENIFYQALLKFSYLTIYANA